LFGIRGGKRNRSYLVARQLKALNRGGPIDIVGRDYRYSMSLWANSRKKEVKREGKPKDIHSTIREEGKGKHRCGGKRGKQ